MTEREFATACERKIDAWIPACGGTEQPFLDRNNRRFLYVYNPSTGKHAYLNLETDMIDWPVLP